MFCGLHWGRASDNNVFFCDRRIAQGDQIFRERIHNGTAKPLPRDFTPLHVQGVGNEGNWLCKLCHCRSCFSPPFAMFDVTLVSDAGLFNGRLSQLDIPRRKHVIIWWVILIVRAHPSI